MGVWAHRNAQRAHTHRETVLMPSSRYPTPHEQYLVIAKHNKGCDW
jgi:hypothetical protein